MNKMKLSAEGTFGRWLAQRRYLKGVSQIELARIVGVDKTTVSRWEWNRALPRLNPFQMKLLLDTLGISFEELIANLNALT